MLLLLFVLMLVVVISVVEVCRGIVDDVFDRLLVVVSMMPGIKAHFASRIAFGRFYNASILLSEIIRRNLNPIWHTPRIFRRSGAAPVLHQKPFREMGKFFLKLLGKRKKIKTTTYVDRSRSGL